MGNRLWAICLAILVCSQAEAATWTVERDGSGQFTDLQSAIDAAAAGDTIAVGPGRYDQAFRYEDWGGPFPAGVVFEHVIAVVEGPLTIRGAGADLTVIGPAQPEADWVGIAGYSGSSLGPVRLQDVAVENLGRPVWSEIDEMNSLRISLSQCRFRTCAHGVSARGDVTDCEFSDMGLHALTASWGMTVHGCSFDTGGDGLWIIGSATVTDCTFRSLERGIAAQVYDWNHVVVPITGCTFDETVETAVSLQGWVETRLDDCEIRAGQVAVKASGAVDLTGSGNILRTADGFTIYAASGARISLHGNHILRDAGFRIVALANYSVQPPVTLDLTGNWWGGLSAQEIRPRILDGYATPVIKAFVEFEPMADGPLPARPVSWGGLHGLYR